MSSVFSENAIETMKKIRKVFLWVAVCILIGEVVVGAILILVQKFDPMVAKLMGTFALCAVAMFIGVNNFSRMEKGDRIVQGFATVSLVMNMVWLVLAILLIWEIVSTVEYVSSTSYFLSSRPSVVAKIAMMAVNLAISCFLISNVWSIKETVKPVKPLKITALFCELYCGIYAVVVTLGDVQNVMDMRWYALAGLAGFAFIVMAIAAVIVSRSGEKKNVAGETGVNKEEMQATIQEMVEKEVQERLKAEREKAGQNAMPPLQSDGMPPVVNRDGEIKVEESNMSPSNPGTLQKSGDSVTPERLGNVETTPESNSSEKPQEPII